MGPFVGTLGWRGGCGIVIFHFLAFRIKSQNQGIEVYRRHASKQAVLRPAMSLQPWRRDSKRHPSEQLWVIPHMADFEDVSNEDWVGDRVCCGMECYCRPRQADSADPACTTRNHINREGNSELISHYNHIGHFVNNSSTHKVHSKNY